MTVSIKQADVSLQHSTFALSRSCDISPSLVITVLTAERILSYVGLYTAPISRKVLES